ncbi:MAG: hypothetical protein MN733_35825, partial [Nitrososphaera sp.]|nr:hypothetical protein [Nitrososphaera sp.]
MNSREIQNSLNSSSLLTGDSILKTKHSRLNRNAAFGLIAALALPAPAFAAECKAPDIKVVNDRSTDIKVKKIQYYDGCDLKWRTEDVSDEIIAASGGYTYYHDDLEYVQSCDVPKFKLYRQVWISGSGWGSTIWGGVLYPDEADVECITGKNYTIH